MWAKLATWMVQDDEVPELRTGDVLRGAALVAECTELRTSQLEEGLAESVDDQDEAWPGYEASGTVVGRHEAVTSVLEIGSLRVAAEPEVRWEVPEGRGPDAPTEPVRRRLPHPEVGSRVTVSCRLRVMAAYEADDVDSFDVRRDWTVGRILLVRARSGAQAQVEQIPRVQRWADETDEPGVRVHYLLDLAPVVG